MNHEITELPAGFGADLDPIFAGRHITGNPSGLTDHLRQDLLPFGIVEMGIFARIVEAQGELPPICSDTGLLACCNTDPSDFQVVVCINGGTIGALAEVEKYPALFVGIAGADLLAFRAIEIDIDRYRLPVHTTGFHHHPAEGDVHPAFLSRTRAGREKGGYQHAGQEKYEGKKAIHTGNVKFGFLLIDEPSKDRIKTLFRKEENGTAGLFCARIVQ
jgi:hypothetical protein